ncbi:hypothetical protein CYMTET_50965 [Cymbomonas tetramitiformis]|uniref:Uncharacterized protein n=1 Tax=Cymbomonas tetramitiformis TaxID=36881 RepID=A0AAE0BM31_9CHLO|nr:hypothetical protein CYMTET_50965 [Cymbomonas tetramitiformis]
MIKLHYKHVADNFSDTDFFKTLHPNEQYLFYLIDKTRSSNYILFARPLVFCPDQKETSELMKVIRQHVDPQLPRAGQIEDGRMKRTLPLMKFLGEINSHYRPDMDREEFDRCRVEDNLEEVFTIQGLKVPNWNRMLGENLKAEDFKKCGCKLKLYSMMEFDATIYMNIIFEPEHTNNLFKDHPLYEPVSAVNDI